MKLVPLFALRGRGAVTRVNLTCDFVSGGSTSDDRRGRVFLCMLSGPDTVPSGGKGLKVQRNRENSCESSEFESVKRLKAVAGAHALESMDRQY